MQASYLEEDTGKTGDSHDLCAISGSVQVLKVIVSAVTLVSG